MANYPNSQQPHQAAAMDNMLARPPRRKKRRVWRILSMLAMLAALVWLLPGIVAHSPLLGWIVRKATADLNGTVSDDSELEKVEYNVDGGLWKKAEIDGDRWSASFPFPMGEHSVCIRAIDRSGNITEEKLRLIIR